MKKGELTNAYPLANAYPLGEESLKAHETFASYILNADPGAQLARFKAIVDAHVNGMVWNGP